MRNPNKKAKIYPPAQELSSGTIWPGGNSFDKALAKKEQNQFLKTVKPGLGLPANHTKYIFTKLSDFNCQTADYAAWAKCVSLGRSENHLRQALEDIKITSFDIFKNGKTKYR